MIKIMLERYISFAMKNRKSTWCITCLNNALGEEIFIAFMLRLFLGIPAHLNCIFMFKTAVIVYPISIYEKEVTRKMI